MSSRDFQERLARRARRARVIVGPELGVKLETYYRLLAVWNAKINLTGLKLAEIGPDALDRLLIEPLIAATHIRPDARAMIDIGSGGGSPAIPLALSVSGARIVMVESKVRKAVFLREALRALELTRCEVMTSRYEALLSLPRLHEAHDLLTLRAVRVEARQLRGLQAFVRPGGELFLFRSTGSAPGSFATVSPPLAWRASFPLVEQASRLVILEKQQPAHEAAFVSRETQKRDR